MAEQKLGSLVSRERKRLAKKQAELSAKYAQVQRELAAVDLELAAAQAYEQALGGASTPAPVAKATPKAAPKAAPKEKGAGKKPAKKAAATPAATGGKRRPRRGSRREAIVEIIGTGAGASRGDILDAMGIKGDKAAEQAVSNALTAMKKGGRIKSKDGKYIL